jgi:hypothetical protein
MAILTLQSRCQNGDPSKGHPTQKLKPTFKKSLKVFPYDIYRFSIVASY